MLRFLIITVLVATITDAEGPTWPVLVATNSWKCPQVSLKISGGVTEAVVGCSAGLQRITAHIISWRLG